MGIVTVVEGVRVAVAGHLVRSEIRDNDYIGEMRECHLLYIKKSINLLSHKTIDYIHPPQVYNLYPKYNHLWSNLTPTTSSVHSPKTSKPRTLPSSESPSSEAVSGNQNSPKLTVAKPNSKSSKNSSLKTPKSKTKSTPCWPGTRKMVNKKH